MSLSEPFQMRAGWKPPHILPCDEREAAKMVWDQLDLTPQLRSKKPLFVEAHKKQGTQRAQTEDCVRAWVENLRTKPGSCMIVSSNPYVNYQIRVTFMILNQLKQEGFILDGVGKGCAVDEYPQDIAIGILMDNLARTLYTENRIKALL